MNAQQSENHDVACRELTCPHHGAANRRKLEHDHPDMDCDRPFSYCWPCPACGVCKFIGHGPLCWECYTDLPPASGEVTA